MTTRTKTYLATLMKNWAASLAETGISPLDPDHVTVEYMDRAEGTLSCLLKVTDKSFGVPQYFEIKVTERY